jgi:hypothetical protein
MQHHRRPSSSTGPSVKTSPWWLPPAPARPCDIEQTRQLSHPTLGSALQPLQHSDAFAHSRTPQPARTSHQPCPSNGATPSRLEVHGDIGPFTATISYLLAPTDHGTRLTNVVDLESASGPLRLAAPLAASKVKTAVAANLDTLKQLLEAGAPR